MLIYHHGTANWCNRYQFCRRCKTAIKTWKIVQEKAKFIAQALTEIEQKKREEANPCPYPNWKEYAKIRKVLTPDKQKEMQANIGKKDVEKKIEIFPMKKKFSIFTAEHNGKDIFKGEYKDKNGDKGIKWVTYLTGKAAENECKKQWLIPWLLKDRAEVAQFISYFPGESTKEKIFNFVQLFGLEKAGYLDPSNEGWGNVGSVGCAKLSRVSGNDGVYGVEWSDDDANIDRYGQKFPSPFVACEDC